MPDSHRTSVTPPLLAVADAPMAAWDFTTTTESLAAEWVRAHDGRLINVARADAIVMRKTGDDVHEIRAVFFGGEIDVEPVLFRGTFKQAGDVMANLGDALGVYVPTTADDRDPEEGPAS